MDDVRSEEISEKPDPSPRPPISHSIKAWIIRILLVFMGIILVRWGLNHYHLQRAKTNLKPVPVVLGIVQKKDMPIYLPALGTVTPLETVMVKTQINGQLQKIHFTEGQMVKTGDLLAEIDPRPYEAQLEQFQGQLARDEALLANARKDLERYETLFKQDSVSQQTLETQRWLVRQLEGTVQLDMGQLNAVKVNLNYCRITATIDGQIGILLVDRGNFVQTTDPTGIVIINTIQPITVSFSVAEDNLPRILEASPDGRDLVVEAYDRAQNKQLAIGKIMTVDNQIDQTTGTIRIRALFENENRVLFPNQFVNVQLKVSTLKEAIVVPKTALQYGPNGPFVFLAKKQKNQLISQIKPVSVLVTLRDEVAVKGELEPNQQLVVEGADNLNEGTFIKAEAK